MATNKSSRAKSGAGGGSKASKTHKSGARPKGASGGGRKPAARGGHASKKEPTPNPLLTRKALGVVLLVVGLFLTAAFITGRGAVLGESGMTGFRYLMGAAGLFVPPAMAVAGILLLVGPPDYRRLAGASLLFVAAASTLAAPMTAGERFEPGTYMQHGGLVGSLVYAAVYSVAGIIGAVLLLVLLYVAGLLLLTGVTAEQALLKSREFLGSSGSGLMDGASALREKQGERRRARAEARNQEGTRVLGKEGGSVKRAPRPEPRTGGADSGVALEDESETIEFEKEPRGPHPEPSNGEVAPASGQDEEPRGGFEVVLPESRKQTSFEEVEAGREIVSGDYSAPPMSMLKTGKGDPEHDAEQTSERLTRALSDLGVEAHVLRAIVGPRVTRYELRLGSGIKVGKIRNLQQDIAYALAATEVRILAPIPGKSAVGVEVPNTKPATVTLGDVFQEYPAGNDWALPVGLGKDISGKPVFLDLAEMPHLLVAGTTGSGKSVMLNNLLTSLILTADPRRVKLVLIDPKRVELSQFGKIPHLITPVVTDVKKAANALSWAVAEMERRYEMLEKHGARSLDGYNERFEQQMPYVVVVIDELADLMMAAASKVEDAVIRLAQKARAVGIHLVVATQRPSVDVITGMIKANIPSRIAFAVSSQVDSRVILDTPGAEALLGSGDMLFKPVTSLRSSRVQGAYITEREVEEIVKASTGSAQARYVEEVTEGTPDHRESKEEPEDDLLPEAASFVVSSQQASVSAVQRRFRVGYSRAGRIVDALERKGVVGPYEGSKARSISATEMDLQRIFSPPEEGTEDGEDEPETEEQAPPPPSDGAGENAFSRSRLGSVERGSSGSVVEPRPDRSKGPTDEPGTGGGS
ncbi:FtsK/SpoIIIE family DNA translocase [Rubrobacter aplysinae]|uniref:FtsK/SpoIIIE family DNA translocase n=1 Tax=Rubrobacter aplysinae TaxID=909625 RepID=UPI00069E85CD|nr:DNA translocase FtsK [Rubrobacter aplysinae]